MFKDMRKDGLIHPAEKTKPALRGDCIDYLNAFRSLGASRLWNQVGPQRLQWSEIDSRLDRLGYRGEEHLKAGRLISMLDEIEIHEFYDKQSKVAK